MKSKSLLELRGHHLGIVYDILAPFRGKAWTRKNIEKSLSDSMQSVLYPLNTLQTAFGVPNGCYWRLFFGKSKILIVEGADSICESGCIQFREICKKSGQYPKEKDRIQKVCSNRVAKEDLFMLKIFDYKIGQIILGEEIVTKASVLVNKFPWIEDWTVLMDFHRKTSR